jgi:hypothetical protein
VRATVTTVTNSITYTQSEAFCRYVIQTDSPFIILYSMTDLLTLTNDIGQPPGYNGTGLKVNGVEQGLGQVLNAKDQIMSLYFPLPGGLNTLELLLGPAGIGQTATPPPAGVPFPPVSPLRRSIPIMSYSLAPGAVNNVIAPTAPAKRIVVMPDSIGQGAFVSSGSNQNSVYQAWPVLMRENALVSGSGSFAGAHLINAGYSGQRWSDETSSGALITASVNNLALWLDGTVDNILICALGTNDWTDGISAATLQTNLSAWITAVHAAFPTLQIVLVTPTTRANENTPNSISGSTLPDIRTAIANVAAANPGFTTLVSGPTLVTYPTNFASDLVHLNTTGMAQYQTNIRADLGIY